VTGPLPAQPGQIRRGQLGGKEIDTAGVLGIDATLEESAAFQAPQRRAEVAALQAGVFGDVTGSRAGMVVDMTHHLGLRRGERHRLGVHAHAEFSADGENHLGEVGQLAVHGQRLRPLVIIL
jgi:hypothetical protein